jgi:DNA-binding NtrC family response regulator
VPSLRQRRDDLPLLVDHFLDNIARRTNKPRKRLHPELMSLFYDAPWPGNVRQLENEVERLVVLSGDAEIIPPELHGSGRSAMPQGAADELAAMVEKGLALGLSAAVEQLERDLIQSGLRETRGNRSKLAERLGISRTTLIKKIKDYNLHDAGPQEQA